MKNWFTVEPIDSNTYAISEYAHWEEPHSYLLCGEQKALLIDTGLGVANIRDVVDRLTSLPVMVATTHVHWDHIGGHRHFDCIAVHEAEKAWLAHRFPLPLEVVLRNLAGRPCDFPEGFDLGQYQIFRGMPQIILHEGSIIDLGGRKVEVLHTPGHSPGHCCFYESDRRYLYAGDLIYRGCLDAFYPTTDPSMFWQSVRKVCELEVRRVLPGHHTLELADDLISRIEAAFADLAERGMLVQGNGLYEYGDFQIHI